MTIDEARDNLAQARAAKIRAENELTRCEAAVDQAEAILYAVEESEIDYWARS